MRDVLRRTESLPTAGNYYISSNSLVLQARSTLSVQDQSFVCCGCVASRLSIGMYKPSLVDKITLHYITLLSWFTKFSETCWHKQSMTMNFAVQIRTCNYEKCCEFYSIHVINAHELLSLICLSVHVRTCRSTEQFRNVMAKFCL